MQEWYRQAFSQVSNKSCFVLQSICSLLKRMAAFSQPLLYIVHCHFTQVINQNANFTTCGLSEKTEDLNSNLSDVESFYMY